MNSTISTIAEAYIRAVGDKQFDAVSRCLHPAVEFSSPDLATLHGADQYIGALRRLGTILLRNEVKRTFAQENEVCIIYDFVTDTPVGALPSVEWLQFENGKIKSVYLIFHSLHWPAARDEAMRRAKSGSI
jgi:hypothetical protein